MPFPDKHRDILGRVVRTIWIEWAKSQPAPKPSWLVPYDELSEPDKEADRQIAEKLFDWVNSRRHELIHLGLSSSRRMTDDESEEMDLLQNIVGDLVDWMHPRPSMLESILPTMERLGEPLWTDEECFKLNAAQHDHTLHGYTCGTDSRHRPLIATRFGWKCCDCNYRQRHR